MAQYPRRDHFEHFKAMQNPFLSLTVQVDITSWMKWVKSNGYPVFLSFLYAVGNAANSVPELRQRITPDRIVQYDECFSSYTVMTADGTYRYCNVSTSLPFSEYLSTASEKQKAVLEQEHLEEEGDVGQLFFISCLPWVSFSHIDLPYSNSSQSNPAITWGKFYTEGEKVKIPVSISANHALVDGIHVGQFFSELEKQLEAQTEALT